MRETLPNQSERETTKKVINNNQVLGGMMMLPCTLSDGRIKCQESQEKEAVTMTRTERVVSYHIHYARQKNTQTQKQVNFLIVQEILLLFTTETVARQKALFVCVIFISIY
jgi:hypothetical protein